jgi:hypothetical protein
LRSAKVLASFSSATPEQPGISSSIFNGLTAVIGRRLVIAKSFIVGWLDQNKQ